MSTPITRQCDTRTTYNGEADGGGREPATPLLDILGPFVVILEAVGRDTDDLYIALSKVWRPELRLVLHVALKPVRAHLLATSASSVVQTGVKSPG